MLKKNQMFLATAAAITVTATALPAQAAASTPFFTDVKEGNALYPEIKDLHSQGKINGFTDGTFRPQGLVTRGQAAKMIADLLELNTTSPKAPNFKDVKEDKWYYGAIAALVDAKIMGGFKDGTFRPDQTLTRAEASRLIGEAFKLSNEGKTVVFTDVKKDKWYCTYVQSLVHNKVTAGKTATTFAPDANVTRGELVAFASRAKKAVTPAVQTKTIQSVQSGKIIISGKTYTASDSVKELLKSNNNAALKGAEIEFTETNGVISAISNLKLKAAGTEAAPVILDGSGAEIQGNVTVDGDNYELKNITIKGNLTVTTNVKTSFSTDKLTVLGTTFIQEDIITAAASITQAADENPKTRIKITFKDSSVAVIEISKQDVYFSASGSTKVTALTLFANTDIFADEDVIIPKVDIKKGVTEIQLNATIQDVVIDSNDDIQVSGKGNFSNVIVNTDKKVTLATTGAIQNLDMKNEKATLNVGNNAKITNISVPEGQDVSKVVDNYETVKEKIETVGGEKNPDYTPPAPVTPPSSGGGSDSGNTGGPVITPPSSGSDGGNTGGPVVTPPVTPPNEGNTGTTDPEPDQEDEADDPVVTPPVTSPNEGDTGTTDPEPDAEDETGDYFAAGILRVDDQFGYVKLNIKNQGTGKVLYQQIPESDGDFTLPEEGDLVPAEAVEYTVGASFINWRNHDLVVYRVDSSNEILDVVEVADSYSAPFNFVFHDDETVTIQALLKTNGQSVDEFMNYLYAYHDGVKKKLLDFSNVSWNAGTGIPSFTINLQKIDEKEMGFILISAQNWASSEFIGNTAEDEVVLLQVLHDLARDSSEELWGHEFLDTLANFAYEPEERTDADGKTSIWNKSIAEQDSLSVKTYKQRLIAQEADLQTAAAVKAMVANVNKELKEKVDAFKAARQKVDALFKEDRYAYPREERLREGVTQMEFDEARTAVEAVSDEFEEKIQLTHELDDAERTFSSGAINAYIDSLSITVPADLEAEASLTSLISNEGKPARLTIKPVRTGRAVINDENSSYSNVQGTSSYVRVENNQLILIRPNQTGKDITEHVAIELKLGDQLIGTRIIPITIQSSERDEAALSKVTEVGINWNERSVSEIDQDNKVIYAYRGTSINQLLKSLTPSDHSGQFYQVKDAAGTAKTSGRVAAGDKLTVTAENGQNTADYTIQTSIHLTNLQVQQPGSFTFNAIGTNAEELQNTLTVETNSDTVNKDVAVVAVEGSTYAYKATFANPLNDQEYWINAKNNEVISVEINNLLIWRSFSLSYLDDSYPKHSIILKEEADTVDITSADEVNVTFAAYEEADASSSETVTVDGVTISPSVAERADGSYKITFSATGEDKGEINHKFYNITIKADGIENKQLVLSIQSNGDYDIDFIN